jgi:hypothetical protein
MAHPLRAQWPDLLCSVQDPALRAQPALPVRPAYASARGCWHARLQRWNKLHAGGNSRGARSRAGDHCWHEGPCIQVRGSSSGGPEHQAGLGLVLLATLRFHKLLRRDRPFFLVACRVWRCLPVLGTPRSIKVSYICFCCVISDCCTHSDLCMMNLKQSATYFRSVHLYCEYKFTVIQSLWMIP